MAVRIEKDGPVWTVIHSRYEARNAMDPKSARELFEAFAAFDTDDDASVAVFWGEGGAFCAGWDLKNAAALSDDDDGVSTLRFDAQRRGAGHSRRARWVRAECSYLNRSSRPWLGRLWRAAWSWPCGPTSG